MPAEWIKQDGRTLADLVKAYKDKLLMIVFYAEWCKPCTSLIKYVLPAVAKQAGEGVAICLLDIKEDENYFAYKDYKSRHIPLTVFFREGKEIERIIGMKEVKAEVAVKAYIRRINYCQKR